MGKNLSDLLKDMELSLEYLMLERPKIHRVKQNTPEWLEMRRSHFTASETPIVLGLSPWTKPYQLAQEKFGGAKPQEGNKATAFGHEHEDAARKWVSARYGIPFRACVMTRGKFLASLDGKSRLSILELKCPISGQRGHTWKETKNGIIPKHYMAQIQHQLMVSGAKACYFVVYDPYDVDSTLMRVVLPNRTYWETIITAWSEFVNKYAYLTENLGIIP